MNVQGLRLRVVALALVAGGAMFLARAVAEFEFTLALAAAPVDRFARGQKNAMSDDERRGALLFFGAAGRVQCHSVPGQSDEMFGDFRQLLAFVRDGLRDPRATPERLRKLIPKALPSGRPVHLFQQPAGTPGAATGFLI